MEGKWQEVEEEKKSQQLIEQRKNQEYGWGFMHDQLI